MEAVGTKLGVIVGETVGEEVGETVGDIVGETVGAFVGDLVGETVGAFVGGLVGEAVGDSVDGASSSSSSQEHGQTDGNSFVTRRQASFSVKGPSEIPTLTRVSSVESLKKLMRLPQVYPSAMLPQTSSVQVAQPQRGSTFEVGGADTGGDCTGAGTGATASSVLNTVFVSYVLYVQKPS